MINPFIISLNLVYEANGKPKNGKLFGYNGDLGDYDQCLTIQNDPNAQIKFTGQYCLVSIQSEESESIKNQPLYKKNIQKLSESSKFITDFSLGMIQGVCLPSTCNINNLLVSINRAVNSLKIVPQKHCSVADKIEEYSTIEIFAL